MAGPSNSVDINSFLAALLGTLGSGGGGVVPGGANFTEQFRRMLDPAFAGELGPDGGPLPGGSNVGAVQSGGRSFTLQEASKDQPYIGMVDPRTEQIRALETAGMFPTVQSLLNPQWLSNNVLSGTGTAPTRAQGNVGLEGGAGGGVPNQLMDMLFGGSLGQSQASTPWAPPGRGGAGSGAPPTGPGAGGPGGNPGPRPSGDPGGPPLGGPSGYFPRESGAGTGAGTNWGASQIPSGLPAGMPQTQPGFQNFNEKGEPDPQGNYNRDGAWIGPANLKPPGEDPDRLRKTLLAEQGRLPKGASPINWGAYGFDDTPEHKPLPDIDWATYSRKPAVQPSPSGPQYNAMGQLMKPGDNSNVYGPSGNPIMFFGPRVGTEETAENWMQFRAGGGMMDPTKMTIVGEQGPEAIMPTAQGQQVVPLGQGAGGGAMDPTAMMQMMQLLIGGAKGMAQGGILPDPLLDPNAPVWSGQMANATAQPDPGIGGAAGNPGQFSGANQPPGGAIGATLSFNPELDAFNASKNALGLGWGSQGNTAFDLGQSLLGNTQGLMDQSRQVGGQSFVTPELQQSLTGQMNQNPGQNVMAALQPVWEQNLRGAMGQLNASAPSTYNSAQQLEGTNLARSALNDFNLLSSQAMQQGVGQQQNAASILGQLLGQNKQLNLQGVGQAGQLGQGAAQTLGGLGQGAGALDLQALQNLQGSASQAGQGQFGRMMQAGQLGQGQQGQGEQARQFNLQYDLAAQNQAYNQQMNLTLQLLLAAMGLSEPTGLQTVVGSQKAS